MTHKHDLLHEFLRIKDLSEQLSYMDMYLYKKVLRLPKNDSVLGVPGDDCDAAVDHTIPLLYARITLMALVRRWSKYSDMKVLEHADACAE